MRLDNTLIDIEDAAAKAHAELEIQKTRELEKLASHSNYLELKAEIDKKYENKHSQVKGAETELVKSTEKMKLDTASKGLQALGALAGEHKSIAVAQATIDGYSAVVGALADKSTPSATLRFINAASMGIMAVANISKIMSTSVPGGGGGGGGSAPSGMGKVASNVPSSVVSSGSFELKGSNVQQPVEAFVVTDSLTNSQDRLSSIRRRATI